MIKDQLTLLAPIVARVKSLDVVNVESLEPSGNVLLVITRDLTKMVQAGVTIKIMPKSPEIDLAEVQTKVEAKIQEEYGDVGETRIEKEPIAFGLVALKITFIIDEAKGTDQIDNWEVEGAANIQVIDFRRALG